MPLETRWIDFGPQAAFRGYLSHESTSASLPGLILVQEAWGVDAHIREVADRFAAAGYSVLAPDLYWVDGGRPSGMSDTDLAAIKAALAVPGAAMSPEAQAVFAGIQKDRGRHLEMLKAAYQWLASESPSKGCKIGSLGFCMGGGLSGALAAEPVGLAASVIFYGQPIPADAVAKVGCKVLCFHGSKDERLMASLPAFEASMQAASKNLEVHVYEGAAHAFFNDTRPVYHPQAARDAFARSLSFLNQALSA